MSKSNLQRYSQSHQPHGSRPVHAGPSDSVTVTATLTGGAFDFAKQSKDAARQRYGDRDVISRCEQTFRIKE